MQVVAAFSVAICQGLDSQQFGFINLQEDVYYVYVAPVHLDPLWIQGIKAGKLLITPVILWILSLLIGRIQHIWAIRFA